MREFYDRSMGLSRFTFIGEVVWAEPKPNPYIECGIGIGSRWVRFRIVNEVLSGDRGASFKEGVNLKVNFVWCWGLGSDDIFQPGDRFVVGVGKCEHGVCDSNKHHNSPGNEYVKISEGNKEEVEKVINCIHKFDMIAIFFLLFLAISFSEALA